MAGAPAPPARPVSERLVAKFVQQPAPADHAAVEIGHPELKVMDQPGDASAGTALRPHCASRGPCGGRLRVRLDHGPHLSRICPLGPVSVTIRNQLDVLVVVQHGNGYAGLTCGN